MDGIVVGVVLVAVLAPFVAALVAVRVFDRLRRPRIAAPVPGTVTVTAVSSPTQHGPVPTPADLVPAHEDFVLEGVVHVPGRAPYPVRLTGTGWTHRWPRVGQTVPVVVDGTDPSKVRLAN